MSGPLLEVRHLCFGHHGVALLPPLDAAVGAGERVAILGRNGSGKSTLLRVLLGLQPALGGEWQRRPDLAVAWLPQRDDVDDLAPTRVDEFVAWSLLRRGQPARAARPAVDAALDRVGCLDLRTRRLADLSSGERQRVRFARLWAAPADLAVLDEPTAAMDPRAADEAMQLLDELVHEHGTSVIFVSHSLELAVGHADRIWVLDRDHQQVHVTAPTAADLDAILTEALR